MTYVKCVQGQQLPVNELVSEAQEPVQPIVLAHWNNSPRVDMSLHSDTSFWFRVNKSLLFLINDACLAEKQQIPILWSLVWPDRDSNLRALGEYANHYATDAVL